VGARKNQSSRMMFRFNLQETMNKMIANIQVSIQQISDITNRKLSFVRFLAKKVDIDVNDEKVSIDNALLLTKMLCSNTADTEEIHELREENKQLVHDKHAHEITVEFLKFECRVLKEKLEILEDHLKQSEGRTDRFEASLLKMAESVSHLANNRDALMGQMLKYSSWHIKQVDKKEVLVLSKPVNR
jgi:FtsZ-binding cell division protein ZapB